MKKSPISRQPSGKQKAELALRRRLKKEMMEEQLRVIGYVFCQKCGGQPDFRGIQLCHEIPLSQGGLTDTDNCYLGCGHCHFTINHHLIEK